MNINKRILTLFLLLISVAACKAGEDGASVKQVEASGNDLICSAHGGFEERVCKVSMLRAIVDPSSLDEKTIATLGFLVNIDGGTYLFPTKEFAATKDLSSAIACVESGIDLDSVVGGYAMVFGKFSSSRPRPPGFTSAAGMILVSKVRISASKTE